MSDRLKGLARIQNGRPVTWLTYHMLPLGPICLRSPCSPLGPFQETEHNPIPRTAHTHTSTHSHNTLKKLCVRCYICTGYRSQTWLRAPTIAGVSLQQSVVWRRRLPVFLVEQCCDITVTWRKRRGGGWGAGSVDEGVGQGECFPALPNY